MLPLADMRVNVFCLLKLACDGNFCLLFGDNYMYYYYIPINDTSFELSVFWLSDAESRINKLRFSDLVSLSFKTRLTLVSCICGEVT